MRKDKSWKGRPTVRCLRGSLLLMLLGGLLATAGPGWALERAPVERLVLPNGLTFLLLPRPSPAIAFEVRVKAGSLDEEPGKTGLTHMLEHMMFKGTTTVGTRDYPREEKILAEMDAVAAALTRAAPEARDILQQRLRELAQAAAAYQVPGEFDKLYTLAGALDLNATTSADLTSYHVTLPRGRLEFWAVMESQRMQHPVFREFYTERDVVLKERAQRVDSNDKGTLTEQFLLHAFSQSPYRTPVIGFRQDVEGLTRTDLQAYYQAHYRPENTVIAIVGGFEPQTAKQLLTRYFGPIPRGGPGLPRPSPREDRRAQVRLKLPSQEQPFLIMGFAKPSPPTLDDTCFDVIEEVLAGSESARLVRAMVSHGMASDVSTYNGFPGSRLANLFLLSADPVKGHTNAELEKILWHEIERLKQEGVTPDELAKAIRTLKKSVLQGLETDAGAAGLLSHYEAITGNYEYIYNNIDAMERLTPERIRDCARKYLNPDNVVIAYLEE